MLGKVPQFFFATANLKLLQIRMRSVRSIGKITKAMKMVATAKMKGEVRRLDRGKDFAVGSVQKMLDNEGYVQKKKAADKVPNKTLLVPITGDKGLCGAANTNIAREVKSIVNNGTRAQYKIFAVGEKSQAALTRPFPDLLLNGISQIGKFIDRDIILKCLNLASPTNFTQVGSIAALCMESSLDCDQITIIFNKFKNIITQTVTKIHILSRVDFVKQFKYVTRHEATEPDLEYAKHYFYELYVTSIFYNAFLNANASEQASRMNAMENASKNAREILQKLTLKYNNARQTKITMELIEIISGANAI